MVAGKGAAHDRFVAFALRVLPALGAAALFALAARAQNPEEVRAPFITTPGDGTHAILLDSDGVPFFTEV